MPDEPISTIDNGSMGVGDTPISEVPPLVEDTNTASSNVGNIPPASPPPPPQPPKQGNTEPDTFADYTPPEEEVVDATEVTPTEDLGDMPVASPYAQSYADPSAEVGGELGDVIEEPPIIEGEGDTSYEEAPQGEQSIEDTLSKLDEAKLALQQEMAQQEGGIPEEMDERISQENAGMFKNQSSSIKIILSVVVLLSIVALAALAGWWYNKNSLNINIPFLNRENKTEEIVEETPIEQPITPPQVQEEYLQYSNLKAGYSVEYPKSWKIYPRETGAVGELTVVSFAPITSLTNNLETLTVDSSEMVFGFGILADDKLPQETLQDYFKDKENLYKIRPLGSVIQIGSNQVLQAFSGDNKVLNYMVDGGDRVYVIKILPADYSDIYSEVVTWVVNSFTIDTSKVTKGGTKVEPPIEDPEEIPVTPPIITPGEVVSPYPETYHNGIDNYSFKYPTGWMDKGLVSSDGVLVKKFTSANTSIILSLAYPPKSFVSHAVGKTPSFETTEGKSVIKEAGEGTTPTVNYYIINGAKIFRVQVTYSTSAVQSANASMIEEIVQTLVLR